MNKSQKLLLAMLLTIGLCFKSQAGMPVIDAANLSENLMLRIMSIQQWLEDNTDKPGGIVSYDKYQSEMVVADGVTLEKSGSTLSVKAGGITDTQIAAGALTPAKMNSADAWYMVIIEPQFMTNEKFIEYLNSAD